VPHDFQIAGLGAAVAMGSENGQACQQHRIGRREIELNGGGRVSGGRSRRLGRTLWGGGPEEFGSR
jgi:hypothetical protein